MNKIKWIFFVLVLLIIIAYLMGSIGVGNLDSGDLKQASFITIEGESIRILEKGSGSDMLLIHGTPGSIEDMQPLLDSLALNNHVIAYDRPGHGYSSAHNIPRNLEHNSLVAEKIIEYFKMDSATVIGHSYGGIVAMNLAIKGNDNIEKVYVLGSPLFTFRCETIYKLFEIPIISTCLSWLVSGPYAASKIRGELPTRFAEGSKIPDSAFVKFRQELWSQPKVILSKSLETAQIEADVSEMIDQYDQIKEEVTVIIGLEDVDYYITDLKKNLPLPNLEAEFYPATGHFVQLESLDRLLKKIRTEE